jgi:uncharacterized NAD(P)/FAD-binding protein YdhS
VAEVLVGFDVRIRVFDRSGSFGVGSIYDARNVIQLHNLASNQAVTRQAKGVELRMRLEEAVVQLRKGGIRVTLHTTEIVEVAKHGRLCVVTGADGTRIEARQVVLATGHWSRRDSISDLGFRSP